MNGTFFSERAIGRRVLRVQSRNQISEQNDGHTRQQQTETPSEFALHGVK